MITKDMLIGEAVAKYPEIADVFREYGLHCIGCHVSAYDTIEQGELGHGMEQAMLDQMVAEANEMIEITSTLPIRITSAAAARIDEILATEGKEFFRVTVNPDMDLRYHFSTTDEKDEDDMLIEKDGVRVLVDRKSLAHLEHATLDWVANFAHEGFAIRRRA